MLTWEFCTAQLTSFNEWYIYKYVCNWAAQKQANLRQTRVYYPFASTHMVNTWQLCVQNVHTKWSQIFSRLFEFSAIAQKPRNPRKLMYREYFCVYSRWTNCHICRMRIRETLQVMHLFCVYFITKWNFHQDDQWIYYFNTIAMRWIWNKPSFHIHLDYRMENNVKKNWKWQKFPVRNHPLAFCVCYRNRPSWVIFVFSLDYIRWEPEGH